MHNFTIVDVEQGTPAWLDAKLGRYSGSMAGDVMAMIKSGAPAASRKHRAMQLVLERVTCKSQERSLVTQAMQEGKDKEPDALRLYEMLTGHLLRHTGFLRHTELYAGCSLDAHVGDFAGVVEAKCPLPSTHWEYLRTGKVPEDYYWQCIHALWMTNAEWCDWISYHPEFPEKLRLKLVRIVRDEKIIADYDKKARAFLAEVETEYQAVMTMHDTAAVLRAVVA